jgi:hypothetical protein
VSVLRSKPVVCLCFLLLVAALLVPTAFFHEPAQAYDWTRTSSGGFGDAANTVTSAMIAYGGRLFAGTYNPNGCQVWSFGGVSWTREVGGGAAGTPTAPGFGNANANNVSSMTVYGSRLYAGTRNPVDGCGIWSYDGESWVQEVGGGAAGTPTAPGFGDAGNNDVSSMAVIGGLLFAGTYNAGGCQVWSYDGEAWARVAESGFGDADNLAATCMATYFSRLYVGTFNNDYASGCQVWSYDGKSWNQEVGGGPVGSPAAPGFGDSNNRKAASMTVYNAGLYVGTYDSSGGGGCQVWSYDGANWTKVGNAGFGDTSNLSAASMAANGLDLFVGTYNEDSGCEVWSYDGTLWSREGGAGFGNQKNVVAGAMALEGAKLTAAVQNEVGCQVWESQVSSAQYFAEGYTGASFQEYLCLGNPQARETRVAITYLFADGTSLTRVVNVPAESRLTIFVNADVGADREVSLRLESDQPVIAERPLYFKYKGVWPGGHDAMGISAPSTTWYFAEGYTGAGFEEWVCVLNPGNTQAELVFSFQTQEEGELVEAGFKVPAFSRASFEVNDILGADYQNSLKLESSVPVIAERPMYFDYHGTTGHHWQGGHCVPGVTRLSQVYFFAEGTTRAGFEEWLTLQNPNQGIITISATYQLGRDQGGPVSKSYVVRPGERYTVYIPGEVGLEKDVSIVLASTGFFLAERPMYFHYSGYGAAWSGGDCVIGAASAGTEWLFAEGYTGEGFHTWLCLQNPGVEEATILIDYYSQEEGQLPTRTLELAPGTRQTIFVNEHAGAGYQLSMRVLSSSPIVVERPMYFDYNGGIQGGHVVVGRIER